MKLFSRLFELGKKFIKRIMCMIHGKNPIDVINNTVTTAATIGTSALAVYATVNAIRVHLIPTNKKPTQNKSGFDLMMEDREIGSVDEKMEAMNKNIANIGNKRASSHKLDKEVLGALSSIAKTRNVMFQTLSPDEQINVLEMEGFNFQKYLNEYKSNRKSSLFSPNEHVEDSNRNDAFYKERDYGIFNFIARPINRFYRWLTNNPIPEEVHQIHLVDFEEIPMDIPCDHWSDLMEISSLLGPYYARRKQNHCDSHHLPGGDIISLAELEKHKIYAEELFRHDSYKKDTKAIRRRLMESKFNVPTLRDFFDEEDIPKKKKKKKKKKHSKSDYNAVMDVDSKKKKRKKKKKESNELERDADRRAQKVYAHYLNAALGGDFSYSKEIKFS